MRRALVLFVGLALGAGVACGESLDELLLDALCDDDADCAPGQTCFRTAYQSAASAQGWCRNEASCSAGTQPGCECRLDASVQVCDNTTESPVFPSNENPGDFCLCAYQCVNGQFDDGCPGDLVPSTEMPSDQGCLCVQP